MLNVNDGNTITPAAVAWSNVIRVVVERTRWETWDAYIEDGEPWQDGEPAEEATLLASGHHFSAIVVYRDDTWHTVGWSNLKAEIEAFATKLAEDMGLPLEYNPSWIDFSRGLN